MEPVLSLVFAELRDHALRDVVSNYLRPRVQTSKSTWNSLYDSSKMAKWNRSIMDSETKFLWEQTSRPYYVEVIRLAFADSNVGVDGIYILIADYAYAAIPPSRKDLEKFRISHWRSSIIK